MLSHFSSDMLILNQIKARAIRGFLELKLTNIELCWYPVKGGIFEYGDFERKEGYYVHVHPGLRRARPEVLIAGTAHELAHIANEILRGKSHTTRTLNLYHNSRDYRRKDEIETDLEVINRGFGRELLCLESYRRRRRIHNGYGIPLEHLRTIIQANGKLPRPLTYHDYCRIFRNGRSMH